jgi:hypothetical protein
MAYSHRKWQHIHVPLIRLPKNEFFNSLPRSILSVSCR